MRWCGAGTALRRRRFQGVNRRRRVALERCETRRLLDGGLVSMLSIDSPAIAEGNTGTRLLNFTVTLNPANIESAVTVDYATGDADAQGGSDYDGTSGQLVFLPGEFQKTIPVTIRGDLLHEADETFTVTLSNPTNAQISGGVGTGTIQNDDPPPALSIGPLSVAEGTGGGLHDAVFTVTLSEPSGLPVVVDYATVAGSATEGTGGGADDDYVATTGQLVLNPGATSGTIAVPIVPDARPESDETFQVVLSNPVGATIATGSATGTIQDDDPPPPPDTIVAGPDVAVGESAGSVNVRIERTSGQTAGASVRYRTVPGTATPGVDYQGIDGVATFGATDTAITLAIPILPDFVLEGDETFLLELSDAGGGAQLGARTELRVTIVEDDSLIVTNANDTGPGSFRWTILTSNATPGRNTIGFAPGVGNSLTIQPLGPLPALTEPVVIDAANLALADGTPGVTLDGSRAGAGTTGLVAPAGDTVIRGLEILRFDGSGVLLQNGGGNVLVGNVLGRAGMGNGRDGVTLINSANNQIGVPGAPPGQSSGLIAQPLSLASGNVLAGNTGYGVRITGSGSTGNILAGNAIGASGIALANRGLAGNGEGGVSVEDAAANRLGMPGWGNVVSGNLGAGVQVIGPGAAGTIIQGNRIGTDAAGTSAAGNAFDGVYVENAAGLLVGGGSPGAGNLISGNRFVGLRLVGPGTTGIQVLGNHIGTDTTGRAALGNLYDGVFVTDGASNNVIGGAARGDGNLISGNGSVGVQIFGGATRGNRVLGNLVGTTADGMGRLGNGRDGVFINGSPGNVIGAPGAGNLISGNGWVGVQVFAAGSVGNRVEGNGIGINAAGAPRLGNRYGLYINAAPGTVVGAGAARNVIAGNFVANLLRSRGQSGPSILSWQTHAVAGQVATITLTFNAEMNAARASNLAGYQLKLGTTPVALSAAVYDPARRVVVLSLGRPVAVGTVLSLTVKGRGGNGLTDTARRLLDGDGNGRPGGDAILTLDTQLGQGTLAARRGFFSVRRGRR